MEESINFITKKEIETENSSPTLEKELSYEEIINSNNVELIAKYAKENRNISAIDKARELLELARRNGEEIVQNFLKSLKECEATGKEYLDFENTESGKNALSLLKEMPEPFKTSANEKLEDYKKQLERNTELFKKHKNNPEKIWKEVFGFDYYNIPGFKERFKDFLFKEMRFISKDYYKEKGLDIKRDPFSINFFVEDIENFNKARGKSDDITGAFSMNKNGININMIGVKNKDYISNSREEIHEKEHSIHRTTKPFDSIIYNDESLSIDSDFLGNIYHLNKSIKWDYEERLKKVEDEIFAYFKNQENKKEVEYFLSDKSDESPYDYAKIMRDLNGKIIDNNKIMSETEKQKLRDGTNFLQLEYDRVLKNMIDVVYNHNESVEYLRNLPINEWYKASNGKYNRTDFIIKEFKV